jgi:hypothetical protein
VRDEVAREILRIYEESYGTGAANAETLVADNWVIVVLDGLHLLPNEQFLVDNGQLDTVMEVGLDTSTPSGRASAPPSSVRPAEPSSVSRARPASRSRASWPRCSGSSSGMSEARHG